MPTLDLTIPVGSFCVSGVTLYPGLIDEDAMVTQTVAARAIGVSRQLVRDWCLRKANETKPDGSPLIQSDGEGRYRYGDLLDVEKLVRRAGRPGRFERKSKLIAA